MATVVPPPPKRQKLSQNTIAASASTNTAQNVVVQFCSEDGTSFGPGLSLASDTALSGLELLANSLQGTTEDPVPYAFHIAVSDDQTISVDKTLQATLEQHADILSTEKVLIVRCTPQAVFKVREITRCSSALDGHKDSILCASFSPTGRALATGSGDNTARIWDIESELPRYNLQGHKDHVLCVEWDGLERMLATGGRDKTVILWDPKTGKQVGETLRGHTQDVRSISWEPIHLNAENTRLASASKDCTVRVWLPKTRRTEFTLGGHTACVNVVRWGGEGIIYTASSDRTVKLWESKQGRLVRTLSEHAHWVTTLALNTDFVLRTGPFDEKAKRPSSEEEAQSLALKRYQDFTTKNPETLVTGSDDHTLFLWHPQHQSASEEIKGNVILKKPLARMTGHQKQVQHVAFSPDGRFIASASWDNSVKLWDGKTGKFIATLRGHVGAVYRLSWSADSRMLISASKDSTLKLWDLKTFKIRVDLPAHTDQVFCVDFVADKVASGGADKKLRIWRH